jgi:hypothetical protein
MSLSMLSHATPVRILSLGLTLAILLAGCEVDWSGQNGDDLGNANNLAPTLVLDEPLSGAAYGTATAVPFSGTVSDDRDPTEIYLTITSNKDGLIERPAVGADGTFASSGLLTEGSHEITVTATDGGGLQASLSVAIQVGAGGEGAPTLTVAIYPDPPVGTDWTGCDVTSEDPSGLPVTIESNWVVNDEDRGSATEEIKGLFRDDVVVCQVTATSSGGITEGSDENTVANSPPELDEVRLDGAPVDESGVLRCSIEVFDYDADDVNLIFSWLVNNVEVLVGPIELTGTHFDRDDEVVCRATANDGFGDDVVADSTTVVVDNSAPGLPSGITVTPASALIGAGLTCNVATQGNDIDTNDTLVDEFRWTVDSAEVASATSQVFGTSDVGVGQVVACSARTSDGDLAGGWVDSINSAQVSEGLSGTYGTDQAWTTISGTTSGDRLGRALASVGDLNGDGVPELVLGANQYDSNRGRVFLFDGALVAAGGNLDDGDAELWWDGSEQGALFAGGEAVVAAGDVTGGGAPDFLVAGYRADGVGAAYLFAGEGQSTWTTESAEDAAQIIFRGEAADDDFALDVGAADIDGDGLSDVLAGAPFNDGNGVSAGVVTIYLGDGLPSSGDVEVADADHEFWGDRAGELVGYGAMESIGDIDGDGYAEFSIGARDGENSSGAQAGTLFVLSGADFVGGTLADSGNLVDVAAFRIDGENAGDQLSMAAASLGDLNLDGKDDFVVGARFADIQTVDAGGVYVFLGGSLSGTVSAADAYASFGSVNDEDLAGKNLASGDVDGDGFADFMVSAHYGDGSGANSGTASLILGGGWASWSLGDTLAAASQAVFEGNSNYDFLSGMTDLVDLDADGFDEMIIGADGADGNRGTVYVYKQP